LSKLTVSQCFDYFVSVIAKSCIDAVSNTVMYIYASVVQ